MEEVSIDTIVSMVVKEVLKELEKNNVRVVYSDSPKESHDPAGNVQRKGFKTKTEKIDMSAYKSPLLTENHINRLHELTGEIIIPRNTIITPKARQALRLKKITIKYEAKG